MGISSDYINALATHAAERLMRYDWKVWFWGDSIGVEGLLDASDYLQTERYRSFVYGLVKAWIGRSTPPQKWDYTAPGVSLVRLYEQMLDPLLLNTAKEHGHYLAGFRTTKCGAYLRYLNPDFERNPQLPSNHPQRERDSTPCTPASTPRPCVFVDNMHFDGPFYAHLYRVTREDRWRQLAISNILASIQLLFDRDRNLFHHFWIEDCDLRNGVLWGRGQGWALLGIVHTLDNLDQEDPAIPALLEILRHHSEALARSQDSSGHWHTITDAPSSYLESSVSAFVVDGLSRAIIRGWLDDSYLTVVDHAFSALLSSVNKDGLLNGVSYETYPSLSGNHYKLMPRGAMVPWGQGPLLAAIRSYRDLKSG